MTSESGSIEPPHDVARPSEAALRFLQLNARLLVEYNVRSKHLERAIGQVARHVGVSVQTVVGYREVTLALADGRGFHARAPELRINVAVSAGVLSVSDELCLDHIGLDEATRRLETLERLPPRHDRWVVVALFGLAASAIAWLLGADSGAVVASGVSSSVGLLARQVLARRPVILFAQPFAAGLIGAAIGGLAIRLAWTATPGFCLIVPALMLVPGPYLINSVYDMLDNHIPTGIYRLVLAMGILIATALGVVLGGWPTLGPATMLTLPSEAVSIGLPLDMALAGVAACGFGAFYNAPWRVLWVSIVCGMVGHGLRYVGLEPLGMSMSTLFGCLAIGLVANTAAIGMHLPFSALAFAGAVPMMPGVFIYQSMAGAMRLSAAGTAADPSLAATTLALSFKAVFVVGVMAIGLLVGGSLADLASRRDRMSRG
ncbi:Inner membrane protein YjjP [Luteitalea pratensis]|uniref:Inner membrane protein YjjP n=2 Tax=Luteitalea pratensis TaxID=1855912 RepID=A0A143PRI9_LUTPR|nr:threonine/serine exporter family protein [Luteitalea pratensis]AMY10748.1 Inner membrane protein YjjP [Luteitalea pratensis]